MWSRSVRGLVVTSGLALLASSACQKKPGSGEGPAQYAYAISVDGGGAKVVALELDGKRHNPDRTLGTGVATFFLTVPAADSVAGKPLHVILTTTCGETKLPGKAAFGLEKGTAASDETEERKGSAEPGQKVLVSVQLETPERANVYLDMDGAKDSVVTIGKSKLEAKAEGQPVYFGACPEAKEVKVAEEVLGKLEVKQRDDPKAPATAFIDVKGGHCYEKKLHLYMKEDEGKNVARDTPDRMEGDRIYAVQIDHFLEPPPEEIMAKGGVGFRVEIRRCQKN